MAFFKNMTNQPREDNSEPFLDALISMTSNDSGMYVGAGALRNSDVFTAVRVIASDLATNPIEYNDKRISVLLNKAPNDHMTAWAFKFALAANMLLNGNSFARVTKNPSGQVTGFELIANSQMVVKQDDTTGIVSYEYTPENGRSQRLNASEVLHFKCFTQDGYTGLSPLYSLHDEVGVQKAGHKLLKGFFNTGVQGTGILKVSKSQLDAKAKENIRTKFEAANSGNNALKTIILDNDMDYKQLEVNTDILNLVNSSDWTTKQIAKAFGLPLDRLGIESEHSNAVQSNLMYLQNTLIQYFTCFTSEMDAKLATGDNRFSFNTDKLFSADPATMQELAIKGIQGGVYTVNEARAKLNLPRIEGGDDILASLNFTPLNNLVTYQDKQKGNMPNEQR
ncbi:phage portal protein [Lacticaseibacillus casei]|jgi:HK97 family phage portal protein|uniref:phage portal protein n=1 Tax=Lacticaseibacillus casei TaxID=1582 RepID=UPI001C39020D|nr:phage portal protein [Lacticaseibacillus casei]QXG58269.1 phage portal protein [Lacticaseibacillus casei]